MPNDTPRLANRRQNQTQAVTNPAAAKSSDTTSRLSAFKSRLVSLFTTPTTPHSEEEQKPLLSPDATVFSPDATGVQAPEKPLLKNKPVVNQAKFLDIDTTSRTCAINNSKTIKEIYGLMYDDLIACPIPDQNTTATECTETDVTECTKTDFRKLLHDNIQQRAQQRVDAFDAQHMNWNQNNNALIKKHTAKVKKYFANPSEGVATPERIKKAMSKTLHAYCDPAHNLISSDEEMSKAVSEYLTVGYYTLQAVLSQLRVNIYVANRIKKECVANSRELECLFLKRTANNLDHLTLHTSWLKAYPLFAALSDAIDNAETAYRSMHTYGLKIIMFHFVQAFLPCIHITAREQVEILLDRHPAQSIRSVLVSIMKQSVLLDTCSSSFNFRLAITMQVAQYKDPGKKLILHMRADTNRLNLMQPHTAKATVEVNTADNTIVSFTDPITHPSISDRIAKFIKKTSA